MVLGAGEEQRSGMRGSEDGMAGEGRRQGEGREGSGWPRELYSSGDREKPSEEERSSRKGDRPAEERSSDGHGRLEGSEILIDGDVSTDEGCSGERNGFIDGD